jgi:large subunit ribosomal protein L6
MSRIGRQPVPIPDGVTVTIAEQRVAVKGPKGSLELSVHPRIAVAQEGSQLVVAPKKGKEGTKGVDALWGLSRALLANLVTGVTKGFEKRLELHGVGYRAEAKGNTLTLAAGFSHPVDIAAPKGITFAVGKNVITVSGIDKHLVGETAATIRRVRPPEPYQGKGIRYVGEYVRRKAGKVVGTTTGGAG